MSRNSLIFEYVFLLGVPDNCAKLHNCGWHILWDDFRKESFVPEGSPQNGADLVEVGGENFFHTCQGYLKQQQELYPTNIDWGKVKIIASAWKWDHLQRTKLFFFRLFSQKSSCYKQGNWRKKQGKMTTNQKSFPFTKFFLNNFFTGFKFPNISALEDFMWKPLSYDGLWYFQHDLM